MARLIVVSNRVAVPTATATTRPAGWRLRCARCSSGTAAFGSAGAERSRPTRGCHQDHRHGDLTYVVTDLAEARLSGILQRLRQSRAVADPALPARPRRVLAPRSQRLSARQRAFRQSAARSAADDDVIWVHDYHLIPLAKMLRDRGHRNRIGFFLHIPFPPPEILTALPNHEWLIPQLGAYDLVGFQTENDATNLRALFRERMPPAQARTSSRFRPPTAPCRSACSRSASRPASSAGWRGAPCARRWCAMCSTASPGAP